MDHLSLQNLKKCLCMFREIIKMQLCVTIFLWFFLCFTSDVVKASQENTNVLLLYSYTVEGKGSPKFDTGVRSTFQKESSITVNFSTEYMDMIRFSGEKYERQLFELYLTKYKDAQIDVIITYAYPALSFLLKYGEELFPGIPVVFGLVSEAIVKKNIFPDNYSAVISGPQFAGTMNAAIKMLPKTQEVLVVGGTSDVDQQYLSIAKTQLKPFQSDFNIKFTDQLGMDDLLKKIANQPSNSIILYSLLQQDGNGKVFGPKGVAKRIAKAANAPAFGISQTHIGTGIVGGLLNSTRLIGEKCAKTAIKVVSRAKVEPFDIITGGTHSYDFDWQQLKKWNISEKNLPDGSIVWNKQFTIWEQYYKWIIGVFILFLFETLLIAYLFINRAIRIRAETQLKESERKFKNVFEAANVGKSITQPTGEITVNRAFAELLGYDREELSRKTWQEVTPSEEIETVHNIVKSILNGEKDSTRFNKRYIHKNGSYIWADVSTALKRDTHGQPLYFISTIIDVTDLKRAERSLAETEWRYKALFENMTAGFVLFEVVLDGNAIPTDLIIKAANKIFEATTGVPVQDSIGQRLTQILPGIENDDYSWIDIYGNIAISGESVQFEQGSELLGKYYSIIAYQAGPNQCAVTFVDVTDRKKAEAEREKLHAQLQQAQKMEAVGTLAGGVAHDYNNMLSVIIGYTEMALESTDSTSELHADLKEIHDAGRRSMEITRQLLAFARKQNIQLEVLNLNDTIEGMLKMLRRLIGEDLDLQWHPGRNLWPVSMDPAQIDQILVNLCVNARDAISDVGNITIETVNVTLDKEYCSEHMGFSPGEFVMLAVSDNGCGMSQETSEKIFEPFFTTKEKDKGTGLGLSTIFGIVKQNKGFINVYSELDEGTTFKVYLSRYDGEIGEIAPKVIVSDPVASGEVILVVEDEEAMLRLCSKMLNDLGYTVLTASSPQEAIQLAQKQGKKIDLLLTDVIMPEMNGRDLANRLASISPLTKVLFMSGYTANVIAHHGVLEKDIHFVPKPLQRQTLAIKIREALDEE